jgi:hypothetical protein
MRLQARASISNPEMSGQGLHRPARHPETQGTSGVELTNLRSRYTAHRIHEMNDTTTAAPRGLATNETDRLISSDKVEGTPVYILKVSVWARSIT